MTGVSPGQATITAASANGTAEGTISVTVTARTVMTQLFVSPQGSDSGAGSQAAPFATIGRAQQDATRTKRVRQMVDELREGGVYMGMPHAPSSRSGS